MTAGPVRLRTDGAVLVVTIDRPEVRNAIDTATAQALADSMELLDAEDELRAAVITGAGSTFCSGMDLRAYLRGERPSIGRRGFAGIVEQPPAKPLIAAVEGFALAGGFEIALACDIIVAAADARFGLPEVRRGRIAAGGGLLRLPRRAPHHLAMQWALTGELVTAARLHDVGVVNELTPPGAALAAALGLARAIAGNAPLAVKATKQVIVQSRAWSPAEEFVLQGAITEPVRASEDAREGARAFTESRAPRWRAR